MTSNEQIEYVAGHLELCNMSNDIHNEPIPAEATADLRPEDVTADSPTHQPKCIPHLIQLTDVQRSITCAKEVIDRTEENVWGCWHSL